MTSFLDLPQELRDLIYVSMLNITTPVPPTTKDDQAWEQPTTLFDDTPFAISIDDLFYANHASPHTVVNFLCANKQIYAEFSDIIAKARQKDGIIARMDCLVTLDEKLIQPFPMFNGILCWFSLSSIPLVRNTWSCLPMGGMPESMLNNRWARNVPYLNILLGAKERIRNPNLYRTATIEKLVIDIKLTSTEMCPSVSANNSTRLVQHQAQGYRVRWAICAALKKLFDSGIEGFGMPTYHCERARYRLQVNTLVLNVIPPPSPPLSTKLQASRPRSSSLHLSPTDSYPPLLPQPAVPPAEERSLLVARNVADDLVTLWTKLWASNDFKPKYYRELIDRIMRVRIEVDGHMIKERELGAELERGRAERERIALRVGW